MPNTGGMKASVTLGVQAEIRNLKEIQTQLQNAISHVNPDTKKFASLNGLLQKVSQMLQQLSIDSEQPFSKQSQIDSFYGRFNKVSGILKEVNQELLNLDFSQLKLTPEQQKSFDALNKQVETTQDKINNLSTEKLKEVAENSQEMASALQEFGVNINTNTLESAFNKLDGQITKMMDHLEELKVARDAALQTKENVTKETDSKIANANRFLDFLTADDKATQFRNAPEMFDKAGRYLGGGQRSNSRDAFLQSFGLSQESIDEIVKNGSKNLGEMRDKLQKEVAKIIKQLQGEQEKAEKVFTTAQAKVDNQQAKIDRAQTTQQNLQTTLNATDEQSYSKTLDDLKAQLVSVKKELNDFKQAQLNTSEATKTAAKAQEDLDKSIGDMEPKIESAKESLDGLVNAQNNLSNIKTAIANWMGFNQIIQLSRRAVQAIINDIRELDKVMTQIAVVTSMTQKDLWAQMSTYQAIAREYAVSTKGVYEVSQIWYQQGMVKHLTFHGNYGII